MKSLLFTLSILLGINLSAQTNESKSNFPKLDSTLIGQRLDSTLVSLNLSPNDFNSFTEPPLIIRGVSGLTRDSSQVTFFIDRTVHTEENTIWTKPIIGIAWVDIKGNKFHYGKGVLFYRLENPYVKE